MQPADVSDSLFRPHELLLLRAKNCALAGKLPSYVHIRKRIYVYPYGINAFHVQMRAGTNTKITANVEIHIRYESEDMTQRIVNTECSTQTKPMENAIANHCFSFRFSNH